MRRADRARARAAQHEVEPLEPEAARRFDDGSERNAEIDERRDEHVARDPARRVEKQGLADAGAARERLAVRLGVAGEQLEAIVRAVIVIVIVIMVAVIVIVST